MSGAQASVRDEPSWPCRHAKSDRKPQCVGGSDCHFWLHGKIGDSMVVRDVTGAGHESSGVVHEVGPGVDNVKKGDRVAIEAGVPCGTCKFCLNGRYNACEHVVFFSTPPYHGTLVSPASENTSPKADTFENPRRGTTCILAIGYTRFPTRSVSKKALCSNR